jgi:uncharacterized protein (TIGR03435 family)
MRLSPGLIGSLLCVATVCAQTAPPDSLPSFEAASLKKSAPSATPAIEGGPGTADPGRVRYSGLPLRIVIQFAFGVKTSQIAGPEWLAIDQFDLAAKIPEGATKEQFQLMLQRLLAERVALQFHRETRDLDGYNLTVAKGGPKMQPSAAADANTGPPTPDSNKLVKDSAGNLQLSPGNTSFSVTLALATGLKRISARLQTSLQIARMCAGNLEGDGGVIDKTGLTGRYDFNLDFARSGPRGPRVTPEQLAALPTPDGPDFATAVRQQLGLQLIPIKVATDMIVIDHVERVPAAN